jgi:uncharacterized protein YgiM (DUF1202 family)
VRPLPRTSYALLLVALLVTSCATAPPPSPPPPAPAGEPEPGPAPAAPSERPTYIVKSDKTQLRDDPTTKSPVLARLPKNTRVTGMKEKDGWIFVRLQDNRVGWIRADLLRREAP